MLIQVRVRRKPDRPDLQLWYKCPLTGKHISKTAGTHNLRAAERAAERWQAELSAGIITRGISWSVFRDRFEDEHAEQLSANSRQAYSTAMNTFERLMGKPRHIEAISTAVLSSFQAKLRKEELRQASIENYVRHVLSALGWAQKMGMIDRVPKTLMQRSGKRKLMRSRPITDQEFDRMLAHVSEVRPRDVERWQRFLRGLWLSGLRLEEAMRLSWDSGSMRVEFGGRRPRIVIFSDGHKGRYDEIVPMTPDFADLLANTPEAERTGRVFPVLKKVNVTGTVIRQIGEKAGVVVNDQGKFATAHDLRRSFGTRWATRVHPVVLQRLMRHRSIETTMRYYIDLDADKLADSLYETNLYPTLYLDPTKTAGDATKQDEKTP